MNAKIKKNAKNYFCENCDFSCCKESDYNRHLSTKKHNLVTIVSENTTEKYIHVCGCGKSYKHRQNLHVHKKNCKEENKNVSKDEAKEYKELCKELMSENRDLVSKIVKLAQDPKTINNNTTNNTTNNNMTINVFLNEKCKNAINLIDFVKNMQINWEDTKETGKLCIEESLTNLIMDKVKDMDITERPIHCTDKKRLQYYVKDGDWKNKDVDEVFDSVLYDLSKTHINNMVVYGEEHPEWIQSDDNTETYFGITTNCMIYRHEMERRRNKIKKLLSDKVLLKKEDIQNC